MSSRQMDDIEVLLEKLRFLQIMNKVLDKISKWSNKKMSVALVPATTNNNKQAIVPKNMVLDPG